MKKVVNDQQLFLRDFAGLPIDLYVFLMLDLTYLFCKYKF